MLGFGPNEIVGRALIELTAPVSVPLATQVLADQRAGGLELLGREERFENPELCRGIHPDARVVHFGRPPFSGTHAGAQRLVPARIRVHDPSRLDLDAPPAASKRTWARARLLPRARLCTRWPGPGRQRTRSGNLELPVVIASGHLDAATERRLPRGSFQASCASHSAYPSWSERSRTRSSAEVLRGQSRRALGNAVLGEEQHLSGEGQRRLARRAGVASRRQRMAGPCPRQERSDQSNAAPSASDPPLARADTASARAQDSSA